VQIGLWLMAFAFAAYGAAVLAAGPQRRILNFVDYRRVRDPAGLHRHAGRWLLALAAACSACALLATRFDALALAWLLLAIGCVVATLCVLVAGADRFMRRG
jgi:uncharacterized membrane protein YczE